MNRKENKNIEAEIADELGIFGIFAQEIKSMDAKSYTHKTHKTEDHINETNTKKT